jgi:hypothetical protein
MQPVDREGQFKAKIIEYGIRSADSGAVAVSLKAHLTELWHEDHWVPWAEYQQEATGDVWVVKKDGTVSQDSAENLMRCTGWDGSFTSISGKTWEPTDCQVQISKDEYKGQVRYRINYVNPIDRDPTGSMSVVPDDKIRELENRFGAPLRAIRGNVMRNQPAGNGKSAPPAPPKSATPHPESAAAQAGGIPF